MSAQMVDKADLARELYDAERSGRPLEPISKRHPHVSPDDAYAVQEEYARLRVAGGATLVGRKVGATSKAIQELFGIPTPDYGHLFDDMLVENGEIPTDELIQPLVEPELAFVFDRDLAGPGVTRAEVLEAMVGVAPCIEIIDSRIADWQITYVDTVADNGSSARFLVGETIEVGGLDLIGVKGTMLRNDVEVGTATGAAVLGHPADAVAWLANELGRLGSLLCAGHWVLSGSFMTAVAAVSGDTFAAVFDGVGSVSCRFR
jgi:2-keto-4-pentenoate hydratase